MSLRSTLVDVVSRERLGDRRPKPLGAVTAAQLKALLHAFTLATPGVAAKATQRHLALVQVANLVIAMLEQG